MTRVKISLKVIKIHHMKIKKNTFGYHEKQKNKIITLLHFPIYATRYVHYLDL